MKKILVFGTGSGWTNISGILDYNNLTIEAFIDNDRTKTGKEFQGKTIILPAQIRNYQFDYIVIASQYFEEITRQLEGLNIGKESIVCMFDIISMLKALCLFHGRKFRDYLKDSGFVDDLPFLLMQRVLEKNDPSEAWDLVTNCEALFPGDPRLYLLKAYIALKEHKAERAEEFIRDGIENSIIDLRAESSLADYYLANYYEQKGEYNTAIMFYEKVYFQVKGEQTKEIIQKRLRWIKQKCETAIASEGTTRKSKGGFASNLTEKGEKVVIAKTLPVSLKAKIFRQGSCESLESDLIKVNWELTHACNYSCSYCFNRGKQVEKIDKAHFPNALNNALANISRLSGDKINITLTGGEPTIHPEYLKILSWLNKNIKNSKVITITNLSKDIDFYRDLVETVKEKDRVSFVASYHFEQAEIDSFVRTAKFICGNGIKIKILILALPAKMKQVRELYSKLREEKNEKLVINLKLIRRGELIDKDYTKDDLQWINQIYEKQKTKDMFVDIIVGDTTERFYCDGNELIEREMNTYQGFLCYAGVKMAAIDPQGNISPAVCFRGKKLPYEQKNLFKEGTDLLLTHPIICPFDYCSCIADLGLPKYHPTVLESIL